MGDQPGSRNPFPTHIGENQLPTLDIAWQITVQGPEETECPDKVSEPEREGKWVWNGSYFPSRCPRALRAFRFGRKNLERFSKGPRE